MGGDNGETDSPTVGPLRIQQKSPPPAGRNNSATSIGNQGFPAPPTSTPLPYPEGPMLKQRQNTGRSNQLPYPDNDRASPQSSFSKPTSPEYQSPDDVGRKTLAQRRGGKALPLSPGPDPPDKDDLFAAPIRQEATAAKPAAGNAGKEADLNPYPEYHQQYWPPPASGPPKGALPAVGSSQNSLPSSLSVPQPMRPLAHTSSVSTTRGERGSPPPPETPATDMADPSGLSIEQRFAATGISGTATLSGMQAQSAMAAARTAHYGGPPQSQIGQPPAGHPALSSPPSSAAPARRPWTPTEDHASTPYGPPTAFHGPNGGTLAEATGATQPASSPPPAQQQRPRVDSGASASGNTNTPFGGNRSNPPPRTETQVAAEQDFQQIQQSDEPPPAYASIASPDQAAARPSEKHGGSFGGQGAGPGVGAASGSSSGVTLSDPSSHPAFANDRHQSIAPMNSTATQPPPAGLAQTQAPSAYETFGATPASPPPLPEGWMAHLDPSSGQYYYIHMTTQSTQWEFPKGPTPLNLNDAPPMSPIGTSMSFAQAFASPGLPMKSPGFPTQQFAAMHSPGIHSPGFPPMTPGYPDIMGVGTPTVGAFTGPPAMSGITSYNISPTNNVYFGPYLRYTNMDIERGMWLGSIMLVTEAPQPPTIHLHQSADLSPNPRQLKANPIYTHQKWVFYRYDMDLQMEDAGSAMWTYAITSHLGCTRYEFLVAGRYETNWRFIAHSGNDFALNVNANERSRLGGVGFMWKDIMQKHTEIGGFHCQLGLGNQIFGDRLWKEVPVLKEWLAMSGKEARKNAPWLAKHEEDVSHAYFHYYTSHFDQPQLREAFAQIPYILQIDDHDM
jgi:PhoD related phosphatase/WW domain